MIKIKGFNLLFILFYFLFINIFYCFADDILFKAYVDKNNASIGDGIELNLEFSGASQIPVPEIPAIEGFHVQYLGPSTRLSIVNGVTEQSVTHRYLLVPLKEGIFRLGPFSIIYKGVTYTSQEINLTITKGVIFQNAPSSTSSDTVSDAADNLNDRVFLTLETNKPQVYLNESIPLTITLYTRGMRVQIDQYPEFSTTGFTIGSFEQPQQFRQTHNGLIYDIVQFKTKVYAARAGDFILGPVLLKCNLLIRKPGRVGNKSSDNFFDQNFFESFFGGFESIPIDLKSATLPLVVKPFPEHNRPGDFSGAIGDFIFTASVSPSEVNIGDPVTVKMAIKGDGNFNNVSCPVMASSGDFKIYEPQIKQEESVKIFEQVVLPQKKGIKEIPAFFFSFFNPRLNTYQTIVKGPFPIQVNAAGQEQESAFVTMAEPVVKEPEFEENLGKGIVFIKASLGNFKKTGAYLYQSISFWLFQGVTLALFIMVVFLANRNEKLKTNIVYARRLQAPKKAKKCLSETRKYMEIGHVKDFYDVVFKSLRDYLGDRFQISPGALTGKIIGEILKEKKVPSDILEKLQKLFNDCDMIRYAPTVFNEQRMKAAFNDLQICLTCLEKNSF